MNNKYIKPYSWSGSIHLDGGWGDKNKVTDSIGKIPLSSSVEVEVFSKLVDEDGNELYTNDPKSWAYQGQYHESDQKYLVSFNGEDSDLFISFLEEIKLLGEIKCILTSIDSKSPLRLEIDNKVAELKKGIWVPDFTKSKPVAGWEL